MQNCEGLLVTSLFKNKKEENIEKVLPKLLEQYAEYKKFVKFPVAIKGLFFEKFIISIIFSQRLQLEE